MVVVSLVSSIYYLGLYNSSQLKGDLVYITMTFGLAEITGVMTSAKAVHWFSVKKSMTVCCIMIITLNYLTKYLNLS